MNNMTEINDAFYKLGCACRLCTEAFANLTKAVVSVLTPALQIYLAQNKRVKHLALYAKKARTRKKNFNRIRKAVRSSGR